MPHRRTAHRDQCNRVWIDCGTWRVRFPQYKRAMDSKYVLGEAREMAASKQMLAALKETEQWLTSVHGWEPDKHPLNVVRAAITAAEDG